MISLADVLRIEQKKGRAEQLAQLKASTAFEATDDGSSQGDCRWGGGWRVESSGWVLRITKGRARRENVG